MLWLGIAALTGSQLLVLTTALVATQLLFSVPLLRQTAASSHNEISFFTIKCHFFCPFLFFVQLSCITSFRKCVVSPISLVGVVVFKYTCVFGFIFSLHYISLVCKLKAVGGHRCKCEAYRLIQFVTPLWEMHRCCWWFGYILVNGVEGCKISIWCFILLPCTTLFYVFQ